MHNSEPKSQLPIRPAVCTNLFEPLSDTSSERERAISQYLECAVERWIEGEVGQADYLYRKCEEFLCMTDAEYEETYI